MKTQTERPTPETDAIQRKQDGLLCGSANLEFARHLERQRDELLEALEAVMEFAIYHCDEGPGCDGGWKSSEFCNAIKASNAAITNVKGEPKP